MGRNSLKPIYLDRGTAQIPDRTKNKSILIDELIFLLSFYIIRKLLEGIIVGVTVRAAVIDEVGEGSHFTQLKPACI